MGWSTRGLSPNRVVPVREKMREHSYTAKYMQTIGLNSGRFADEDRNTTSRFGDSDSHKWMASQGYFDIEYVFDRKNRFLDLVEHVRRINSPEAPVLI